MLKFVLQLFLFIAAVAGEAQPPSTQDQINFLVPPVQVFQRGQIPSPIITLQSVPTFQARPCHRRNLGDTSPDSGWVRIPLPYNQPWAYHGDDQIVSPSVQPQLKPQSLTEYREPTVDDNKEETVQVENDPDFLDKTVESVEGNSNPNLVSQNSNTDAKENRRGYSIQEPGPAINNNFQNSVQYWLPKSTTQATNNDKIDSYERSPECERNDEKDQYLNNGDSLNNAEIVPGQVHEEALNLLSKCVQDARNAQDDLQGDSRRALSSNLTPLSQPKAVKPEALLKSEPGEPLADQSKLAPHLQNPAKNAGKWGVDSHISLLENGRICYACSTYFDPSCWRPNATTTVKYCNKDNNVCLTKNFNVGPNSILIRDCGNTCNFVDSYGVTPKINSCAMCHTDLCNSAYAVHGINTLLLALIIAAVKHTL